MSNNCHGVQWPVGTTGPRCPGLSVNRGSYRPRSWDFHNGRCHRQSRHPADGCPTGGLPASVVCRNWSRNAWPYKKSVKQGQIGSLTAILCQCGQNRRTFRILGRKSNGQSTNRTAVGFGLSREMRSLWLKSGVNHTIISIYRRGVEQSGSSSGS